MKQPHRIHRKKKRVPRCLDGSFGFFRIFLFFPSGESDDGGALDVWGASFFLSLFVEQRSRLIFEPIKKATVVSDGWRSGHGWGGVCFV